MSKQASFTEQFYGLIDQTIAKSATKQEVKEAINTFLGLLRDFQAKIDAGVLDTKNGLLSENEKLSNAVKETEKKLNSLIGEKVSGVEKTLETKVNELSGLIGYVESLIEYYDDNEVRELIGKMESTLKEVNERIPEAFDPSEIVKDIEDLEKKYQELEKKIGGVKGTVGGVSNLRIQQAFKYILKTEAPSGLINGTNKVYTVAQPIFAVLAFSLNGEVIPQIPNYTISGNKITFSTALPAVYSDKDFEIKYV
mgnify:CR=1 FL=1